MRYNSFTKEYESDRNRVDFHPRHICNHCGFRYEDHAGSKNPDCPPLRCPGNKFPSLPDPRTTTREKEERATRQIRDYWNERQTVFSPR